MEWLLQLLRVRRGGPGFSSILICRSIKTNNGNHAHPSAAHTCATLANLRRSLRTGGRLQKTQTLTVGVRLKVTFRFSATIVARVYGFGFSLILSSNRSY